jgi:hypothetical protein
MQAVSSGPAAPGEASGDPLQISARTSTRPALVLQRTRTLSEELKTLPFATALQTYLQAAHQIVQCAQFERELAERALRAERLDPPPPFPAAVFGRHAGIVLHWAVCQAAQVPEPPRLNLLAAPPPFAAPDAVLLARAWARRPATPALDPAQRSRLARWLARYPDARPWLALALVDIGAAAAAQQIARRWLATAPSAALQAEIVTAFAQRPALRTCAIHALRQAIALAADQPERLTQLCELATALRCSDAVELATALFLLHTPEHPQALPILAHRVNALSDRDPAAAVALYRRHWPGAPATAPIPAPERLLPYLGRPADCSMRSDLLARIRPASNLPSWVQLEQHAEQNPASTLTAWLNLLTALQRQAAPERLLRNPTTLHLLVRATAAATQVAPQVAPALRARLITIWRTGVNPAPAPIIPVAPALLARSALALLIDDPARQVALVRSLGPRPPAGEHWLIAQAVRVYVAVLCRLKRWAELNVFIETHSAWLAGPVFSPRQLQFFRALQRLESERAAGRLAGKWYDHWETLVSRPQLPFQVEALLAYFLEVRHWLAQIGHIPTDPTRFNELAFVIERLARALGERWLHETNHATPARKRLADQVRHADLTALPALLEMIRTECACNGYTTAA